MIFFKIDKNNIQKDFSLPSALKDDNKEQHKRIKIEKNSIEDATQIKKNTKALLMKLENDNLVHKGKLIFITLKKSLKHNFLIHFYSL